MSTARSIALQGLGFTPLLVALQGFGPLPVEDVSLVPFTQARWVRGHPQVIPVPLDLRQALEEDELIMLVIKKFLAERQH